MLIDKANKDGVIKWLIPHEKDQWIEYVPMTLDVLEAAVEEIDSRNRQTINDFDREIAVEMLRSAPGDEADDERRKKRRDQQRKKRTVPDYEDLHRLTILQGCIVAWSYGPEVSDKTIGQLDFKTADALGREIYGASIETEADSGNA